MAILTGPEIVRRIEAGDIVIEPFGPNALQSNSVDLRLGAILHRYNADILDARRENTTTRIAIPDGGRTLLPNILYLGSTVENVWARNLVPMIETRSSLARLGFSAHLSAGWGDVGWRGTFTLEITVVEPLIIYPHMRVCQVAFAETVGEIRPYAGKYMDQSGPTASRAWMDKELR